MNFSKLKKESGPMDHSLSPSGNLSVVKIPRLPAGELTLKEIEYLSGPHSGNSGWMNEWKWSNKKNIARGLNKILVAKEHQIPTFYGALYIKHFTQDEVIDYGLVSLRVVTTVGVNFIVDAFQNSVELEILKYHGIGTGGTAEAAGDTALVTELTTQYSSDNTRATGTTIEGASANIYRTVATNTVDATVAITEHGIFSQAATGGGTLLDRSLFSVVNMISGDSLQTTYDLTFTAGS